MSMFKILHKQILADSVKRLDILIETVARRVQPGQFVIVIPEKQGEWIPLMVSEADTRKGTITVIFKEVGPATRLLGSKPINDTVFSVIGPLGRPATVKKFGQVICAASGVGTASLLPICRALKEAGNKVLCVIGGWTKSSIMLEPQMRLACHKLFIATQDGSYERRGMATHILKRLLDEEKADLVYAVGSVDMMEEACRLTREKKIPTLVQIHSNIFCGTGVCGSCRTPVGGQTLLVCQHGPEFDGHKVDYDILRLRLKTSPAPGQESGESGTREQNAAQAKLISKFFPGRLGKM